jgi:hypothetical protein
MMMISYCKSCGRTLTWIDYFVIGGLEKEFQDMGLCKDCLMTILKDILEEEEQKERAGWIS